MSLSFEPHPLGCPVGLAVTPAEMADLVARMAVALQGLVHLSVHVINPRKGDSYPILNLFEDELATHPRVVLFPGWEDNKRTPSRRIGYARQATLLQRIHDAGVLGDDIEQYIGRVETTGPLPLSLGAPAASVRALCADLQHYLGDCLKLTLTELPSPGAVPISALRVYAPVGEGAPRLVAFPGWSGASESASEVIGPAERAALVERLGRERLRELPGEVLSP